MLIAWQITFLLWFIYLSRRMVQHLHMMQQNSYRNDRFWRWLKPRLSQYLLWRDVLPVILEVFAVILVVKGKESMALPILLAAFYALMLITWHRPTEKKSLVFTARAKRLYAFSLFFVLLAALLADALIIWGNLAAPVLVIDILLVLAFISPVFMMAGTALAAPVEKAINNRYINDAKKIIQEMPFLTSIGITGSYGKTSTKFILGKVLSAELNTLVTPDSYNTPMGITITVRNSLKPIHDVFVAEMGARQKGDIDELCRLVQPKFGILTAIGPCHLESFGSLENIAETKFELIRALPSDGRAVLNFDDPVIRGFAHTSPAPVLSYGLNIRDTDYWAENISFDAHGMHFTVVSAKGERQNMKTALLGKHNIYNILAAVAVARELGMSLPVIARAVATVPPIPHRLVLKPSAGGVTIIDDAFNSNPAGAQTALDVLNAMPGGQKIIITPGMVELGKAEYEENKKFAMACAKACDYVILVGKNHSKPLQDGLAEAAMPPARYYVAEDLQDANRFMRSIVKSGDYVLFENDLPDTFNEK
ncbi:MAG: UDP-N-acetylmuramoyl-tripeptide--D-alanyl-D-alanine ligase [Clostridia bacterium]|nr:UDP-N-acetylmuramoyl-tripeptide--D-alanyl-D-alanine ligase [Clostridia bacterium]